MRKLMNDEIGFIISGELVLVLTVAVLSMVVGLTALRDSISAEFVDLSNAFGAVSQSNHVNTISKNKLHGKAHAAIAGFGFVDNEDDCDCNPLVIVDVCGKADFCGTVKEGIIP